MKEIVGTIEKHVDREGVCPVCGLKHELVGVRFSDGTTGQACKGCADTHAQVSR